MQRLTFPRRGDGSPWGAIQTVEPLGSEAAVVTTASHGGVWVSPAALTRIPAAHRATGFSANGWFEEDCDWCIPYLALGLKAFEPDAARGDRLLEFARDSFRRWHGSDPALIEAQGPCGQPREVRHG